MSVFARISRLSTALVLCGGVLALAAPPALAQDLVPPASFSVSGYSVTEAAQAVLPSFTDSCNAALLPALPFRAICAVRSPTVEGNGVVFQGHADYTVRAHRFLFTVIADVTDGVPVLGTYPQTRAQALAYWFAQTKLGADHARVTIDGQTTTLTNAYLVGPFTLDPPLPDGGTHDAAVATFLRPLSVGTHHVTTSTTLDGSLVTGAFHLAFVRFVNDFTITVTG